MTAILAGAAISFLIFVVVVVSKSPLNIPDNSFIISNTASGPKWVNLGDPDGRMIIKNLNNGVSIMTDRNGVPFGHVPKKTGEEVYVQRKN